MKISFDKYIRELLLQHDCVILPGLGGFVANYKPAVLDASQKTALPPSRQILFNPILVHNDGLLYAHISKETGYGYKEVQAMAEVYFKTISYEVGKGLKFTIDDLGYFFLNKARKIEFVQETTDNLLLASYGLSFLNYRELDRSPGRDKTYLAIDDANPLVRQRRIRKWIYTGAAACLLAGMILIPVKMGYLNLSRFDLGPVDSFRKEQPVSKLVGTVPAADSQSVDPETGSVESENGSVKPGTEPAMAEAANASPEAETPAKTYFAPQRSYHIIVGSFKDFENARHLMRQMADEGYDAEILAAENSFFRVSAKHYSLKEEAITALSAIRNRQAFSKAWILTQ